MKEIIYYEAEDGTRFEDEDECLEYELKENSNYFIQLTETGNITTDWNRTWYCYISLDIKDIDSLSKKYSNLKDIDIPDECGFFCWNDGTCEWENIDEEIDELNGRIMDLEDIKTKLNKIKGDK